MLDALQSGEDVLFDIDWQGARQLKKRLPRDVVRVFILPPDGKALERRLQIAQPGFRSHGCAAHGAAAAEIAHWGEYDYVIVNADIEESFAGLTAILAAERLKRERQSGLDGVRRARCWWASSSTCRPGQRSKT